MKFDSLLWNNDNKILKEYIWGAISLKENPNIRNENVHIPTQKSTRIQFRHLLNKKKIKIKNLIRVKLKMLKRN